MRALLPPIALAVVLLPACKDGPFSPPPGQFFCGSTLTCEIATQYCLHAPGSDGGAETTECGFLPAACTDGPTCACVETACKGTCTAGGDGSVTLTCS